MYDRKSLAAHWDVSLRFVDSLIAARKIEFIKLGKTVRFTDEAVEAYEKAHTQPVTVVGRGKRKVVNMIV